LQEPQKLYARWVRGKGEATEVEEPVGALLGFELPNQSFGPGVRPDDGVVERLPCYFVPKDGCFALVCESNGTYLGSVKAAMDKFLGCVFYTSLYRPKKFMWILFVPSETGFQ
jgi:hypothetical protein